MLLVSTDLYYDKIKVVVVKIDSKNNFKSIDIYNHIFTDKTKIIKEYENFLLSIPTNVLIVSTNALKLFACNIQRTYAHKQRKFYIKRNLYYKSNAFFISKLKNTRNLFTNIFNRVILNIFLFNSYIITVHKKTLELYSNICKPEAQSMYLISRHLCFTFLIDHINRINKKYLIIFKRHEYVCLIYEEEFTILTSIINRRNIINIKEYQKEGLSSFLNAFNNFKNFISSNYYYIVFIQIAKSESFLLFKKMVYLFNITDMYIIKNRKDINKYKLLNFLFPISYINSFISKKHEHLIIKVTKKMKSYTIIQNNYKNISIFLGILLLIFMWFSLTYIRKSLLLPFDVSNNSLLLKLSKDLV